MTKGEAVAPANASVRPRRVANRRLAFGLLLVALGFFGFGFALVPLYNTFCHVTGLNGATDETTARPVGGVDLSRTVTVEFTSTVMPGLPWKFQPVVRRLQIHPGEPATATYLATNLGSTLRYGQAIMSVSPEQAAINFKKIECFCFHVQALAPHQSRLMPVVFYVTRDLPKEIATITVSYSAFPAVQEVASRGENQIER
jgi:cytochrome c oxidase assembly protein subunit 11